MTYEELAERVRRLETALAAHLDQYHVDPEHIHEHVHIHGHGIDEVVGLEEKVGPPSAAALEEVAAQRVRAEAFWGRRDPTAGSELIDDDQVLREN